MKTLPATGAVVGEVTSSQVPAPSTPHTGLASAAVGSAYEAGDRSR